MQPTATAAEAGAQDNGGTAVSESDALGRARESGRNVEVGSLRSESGEVYATPDGDLEAVEHLRPVRARVGGAWKAVDTSLAVRPDGSVGPAVTTVGMEFSGGGDEPLVRLHRAGRELALSWPRPLPEPVLDGATATYKSVLPDVDLQVRADVDSFSHLLIVRTAKAAKNPGLARLRLAFGTEGLEVRETGQGGLEAVDSGAGGAVFDAPAPLMWDSSTGAGSKPSARQLSRSSAGGERVPPGPGDAAKVAPIDVDIPAGGKELVLTPDQDLLTGADTHYPVYIDPQWNSPKTSAWTMVSRYWAASPQWKFNGDSDAGVGYCGWYYCEPYDTKRLFYRIPTSKFSGKTILDATFVVKETHSASCDGRAVELWRTKGISSSTTWNSQTESGFWTDRQDTRDVAKGFSADCPGGTVEFYAIDAVKYAASHGSASTTFGLRASSETDKFAWKRFSDDAWLRVRYNRPPPQLRTGQLSMSPGGACASPENPKQVRSRPKVTVSDVSDPDKDPVAVQFQASWSVKDNGGWKARWTSPRTASEKSGSDFTITLPADIPKDVRVDWHARSWDGGNWSPWSYAGKATGCNFVIDTSVPEGPTIVSGDFPESNPRDPEDPWYDGVGKYGAFTLDSVAPDVVEYRFGVNGDPSAKNKVSTAQGAARTVELLARKPGVNFVRAQAFDDAHIGSEIVQYSFRVKAGQPERAMWKLDDDTGAKSARGTAGDRRAELNGGAEPGAAGVVGSAVAFDGVNDYASTDIPTVDTSASFSVSAWVKLSKMPDTAAVVAAQPGNHGPGFELYYSQSYDRWVFNQYTADRSDAQIVRAMRNRPGGAASGAWTHLVGTYDSVADDLSLYVQGELVGSAHYASPWDARRGLRIGAGSYDGRPGSFFPGSIDELRIFDKPLSADQVSDLYAKKPVSGRPARAVFTMDESSDSTRIAGTAEVDSAVLKGGAKPGEDGVDGQALTLDGVDDYATTGTAQLNNQRGFAVSAWVRLPRNKPDHSAVAVTQAGEHKSGFELYYSSAYDRWAFNQYSADSPDATPIRAMQDKDSTARAGKWVHLVGVHDTVAGQLTLYVNGAPAGSAEVPSTWYAGGQVQIGAGSYEDSPGSFFPGRIDDVRLFDRVLSEDDVQALFNQHPDVEGRWKLDSATGSPKVSPDAVARDDDRHPATLHNGADVGSGWVDSGALELDGVNDYAATSGAPIHTDESYTVTAWAQAPSGRPKSSGTVLSQAGSSTSAFEVAYVVDSDGVGRWEITVSERDSVTSKQTTAGNPLFDDWGASGWNHLAVVYDAFTDEVRLYVNGHLQDALCTDTDDGSGSVCGDDASWADDALSFDATKSLQIGRSTNGTDGRDYWSGAIDDVWAFQGALDEEQVQYLANGMSDVPTKVPNVG
ncbi:LamG-like jellyroll fold domain-containing protein [Wenjunlia tyrosinilytica]|uniref:LamG-like jellyroll fold domain-containing protein n=1 Tax=Wenjunlia tyrosinilytica TaxID=1544741 RepID=A0A918DTX1_9ACTN|nr:LamG-like jellyroll fold domain-containing protein [Wenjunlia tyrosinilytica]GGO81929.1 hypothetical protein GCM10012280_07360 [Wenjunlia tyrosinilytica]